MNLLLLYDEDFARARAGRVDAGRDDEVLLEGGRAAAVRRLSASGVEKIVVGRLGGAVGSATVLLAAGDVEDAGGRVRLRVSLDEAPPPRPGIDVLLAMPRPKALKRIFPTLSSMGVDRVVLLNAARVEKSYFEAKVLAKDTVARLFDEGLEQARDTVRPEVLLRPRFKPFVEDELEDFARDAHRALAHPGSGAGSMPPRDGRLVLAIGPDGGWVPFELALLRSAGFEEMNLGCRALRTEVAIPALLGATGRLRRA